MNIPIKNVHEEKWRNKIHQNYNLFTPLSNSIKSLSVLGTILGPMGLNNIDEPSWLIHGDEIGLNFVYFLYIPY